MSIQPVQDPGLPTHVHRKADADPVAAKRAERQVAILFLISALGTLLFIYAYVGIPQEELIFLPILGTTNAHQLFLGLGLAISLFFIGMGAVHWAKTLMPDHEVVDIRKEQRSKDEDRAAFIQTVREQGETAGLGRRTLIKRTLGLSLGLAGLSPLLMLRDCSAELPGDELAETNWRAGTRLLTDPGDRPIKPGDIEVGAVAQVLPQLSPGRERTLNDIAKDALLLIRIRPEEFNLNEERLSWTYQGIIAFSKICSHMGCAVALYEQTTKHLLCPCHQSTFDVTRAAEVIFGPAARPLPQLPISVDKDGYLIATSPFDQAVGPSYWERDSK